ncbi:hypothetical protein FDA52_17735 [Clostridium botulinum]|nr:hypothetical protein [Clostridium botulinum]
MIRMELHFFNTSFILNGFIFKLILTLAFL